MVDEEQTGKRTPDDVMENMSGFYEAFIKSKKDIEKRKFKPKKQQRISYEK